MTITADWQSLAFTLLYLYRGSLPWDDNKYKGKWFSIMFNANPTKVELCSDKAHRDQMFEGIEGKT